MIDRHLSRKRGNGEDCEDPDLWLDDDTLIPREIIEQTTALDCPACSYLYDLWEKIIEVTGDAEYGRRAFNALILSQELEDNIITPEEVDAVALDDVHVVRGESKRYEAIKAFEREQELKANANRK